MIEKIAVVLRQIANDPARSVSRSAALIFCSVALLATSAMARPSAPAAPSNLSATAVSSSQINLGWTDNSGNESGFIITRAGSSAGPWTQIATVGANVTSYADTGLAGSTTYYYEVKAYNNRGNSAVVGPVSATTLADVVACSYAISPGTASYGYAGGAGSVSVTSSTGCSWSASSGTSWITITAGASGSGSGTVSYSVAANTATSSRSGSLTIAGQTFTITESGAPCTYSISSSSASFGSSGGSGSVGVTASSGCSWTATSGASWITVTGGSSGSGNGTVYYSVAANSTTNSLTGTLTIAGQTFTVSQTGAAPSDTTPPTVSLASPLNGITVSNAISLRAFASDNVAVTKVEFYCDAGVLVGTSTVVPYTSSDDTTTLSNGSHTFYAKAYDPTGNSGVSITSTVTVSNPPPATPGQLQWVQNMVAGIQILPAAVVSDHANNSVVAGGFNGSANFGFGAVTTAGSLDGFVTRTGPDGKCLWARTFGNHGDDRVYSVAVDSQNNVIVTGYFEYAVDFGGITLSANDPSAIGQTDIFVAKYSASGTLLWAVRFGGTSGDTGKAVTVDANDNIYVAANFFGTADFGGVSLTSTPGTGIALVKLSPSGATLWAKRYGTSSYSDTPNAIAVDRSGDVVVTGVSNGSSDLGAGLTSGGLFIAKYSGLDGSCKWARAQGGGTGYGITADPTTGNVIVTGSAPGTLDYGGGSVTGGFFIAAYSPAGAYLWAYGNGGSGDVSLAIACDGSGNLAITGQALASINFGGGWTFSGGNAGWFAASYAISGNNPPTYRWAKRSSANSFGTGAAYDAAGHLLLSGSFSGTVDFGGTSVSTSSFDNGFLTSYTK